MTPGYRVLPAADQDLDEQAAYLAREANLETALRYYDAAAASFEQLTRQPGIGKRYEASDPRLAGLRIWRIEGFELHLIFYRPAGESVEIVRVLHTAREIERAFVDLLNP